MLISGIKGKEFLGAGMLLYDILTINRNWGISRDRKIPRGRFLSRQQVLELFPHIKESNLTGGAVFCDGQVYNPPRLAISFLRSAVDLGADAANYIEVTGFLRVKNRIVGIKARDILSGDRLEVSAKMVLNTAGPWAHRLINSHLGCSLKPIPRFSRDLAFVIRHEVNHRYGLAFSTSTKDADTLLDRGGRHLFAVPWRDYMLIGVWHVVFNGPPEDISVTEQELQGFIDEVNMAYPGMSVSIDDILMINTGLTLFGNEDEQSPGIMSFGKRSEIIDHMQEHNLEGVVTLIGVRATTARSMAEKVIKMVLNKLGKKGTKSKSLKTPIYGGQIDSFQDLLSQAGQYFPSGLSGKHLRALLHNYGSQYREVLKYGNEDSTMLESIGETTVLKAEIVHAIHEEMVETLADVVFRRTDLGTGEYPGDIELKCCADIMGKEKGWDQDRLQREIQSVTKAFPHFYLSYTNRA
jgi:glycerol-3-phosphate dehydrogenase